MTTRPAELAKSGIHLTTCSRSSRLDLSLIESILADTDVLITEGTGSLAKALTRELFDNHDPKSLIIFSRDELKQLEMRRQFNEHPRLRFFIGDIRDLQRLNRVFHGVDYVIHAAALKQVDTAEHNPFEYIETNVRGSQNVIDASIDSGVKKVVALPTDKASSPINLYGATKLCADRLFISGNNYAASYVTRFCVVRYEYLSYWGPLILTFGAIGRSGQ